MGVTKMLNLVARGLGIVQKRAEELRVGDVIAIEVEVTKIDTEFQHVYARPTAGSAVWQVGDQTIWTWRQHQANRPKFFVNSK